MEPFRGETPRERYGEALDRAGLTESLMVESWRQAGAHALASGVDVSLPVIEEVWLAPEEPGALGYRIELRRGERLQVEVRSAQMEQSFFIELFRARGDEDEPTPLLVEWAEDSERGIVYDARASATYLLRIQPELLGGGPVEVEIRTGPSLAFPVEDRSTRNVLSFFGDVRDGGARDHHGVDIFAPRGTPVLAATDGTAYRVQVTPRGGKVVWVRDSTGDIRSYYAHLDSQMVQEGQEVRAGDVLGLVGNTGNAITTPPHLHFGIYIRRAGPVDPWDFLYDSGREPAPLAVSPESFRRTLPVAAGGAQLLAGPVTSARRIVDLPAASPVRVIGGTGRWLRVRTVIGEEGYVAASALETDGASPPDPATRLAFLFR